MVKNVFIQLIFPVKKIELVIVASVVVLSIALAAVLLLPRTWVPEAVHKHADFAVYLDGKEYDFSKGRFMSDEEHSNNDSMHLHDGRASIIHQHESGITLGEFFSSLGMEFTSECFILDDSTRYCNGSWPDVPHYGKTIKMFVNGQPNREFGNYEFSDLDRILITFGSENAEEIQAQIESVPDEACIASAKCPERGSPTRESSCTSGSVCVVG